jgi:hypothetical protein
MARQLMHLIPQTYSRLFASSWEKVLTENAFYIDVIFCRHLQMFLFCGYAFIVSYQQTFLSSVTDSAILCIADLLLKVKMADILTFKTDFPRDSDVVRFFW